MPPRPDLPRPSLPRPDPAAAGLSAATDAATRRHLRAATFVALLAAAAVALLWTRPPAVLDGAGDLLAWLHTADDGGRAIATTALVAVAMLGYVVTWALATSPRRPVRLPDNRGTITVDELARRLRASLLQHQHVLDAGVRFDNRHGRGVRVSVVLELTAHARLAQVSEDAASVVRLFVEEGAGLTLPAPPSIALQYEELILDGGRSRDGRQHKASDAA